MTRGRLLVGFFILSVIFSFAGCGYKEKVPEIDFNDTVELREPGKFQGSMINICVGSMITPEEGYAYYKRLLDYIGKRLDMKVNFVEKNTYAEVNALLKNGSIDVAFVCGGPYVEGHDEFGLELLAAPLVEGKTVYYSYIIVGKNSGIRRLEDLRGKVFAFADPMSNTGKLVPTYMLRKIGEEPQTFFREYVYTSSHDNSIKAVAQGIVDGAAVDSIVWNYMNKKNDKYTRQTKIMQVSDPYGIPPVVVRPGLNNDLKKKIKIILLDMHNEAEGKDILEKMLIDRFVEVEDSNYDNIRAIKADTGGSAHY